MNPDQDPKPGNTTNRASFSFDYRYIIFILLAIIVGMLVVWKPWASVQASDRTVTVTGEATIKAEPDEYVFNPNYEFDNVDKAAALDALTKKASDITAKLKGLGVTDSQIKTNANGGARYYSYVMRPDNMSVYTLSYTITVNSLALSQRVQDYLATTTPTGEVSPQANFSTAKKKALESQARDEATKEARAKADQSAKNLGFKVGAVKSVSDGSGFGGPINYAQGSMAMDTKSSAPSLVVQPGQNTLDYTVSVIYYLR